MNIMNILIVIALFSIVGLAWRYFKKPVVRGAPARTWPAHRARAGSTRKFVVPFSN